MRMNEKHATTNLTSMKQGNHEMISVLNNDTLKVSVLKYTVALYLRHSNASFKAQTWQIVEEDVPK